MCSNFDNLYDHFLLKKHFHLSVIPEEQRKNQETRPNDSALIIDAPEQACLLRWGFKADWSTQLLINARSETVLEKETFAKTRNNRCLIPVQAWTEWRKDGVEKHKTRISIEGIECFALGAIRQEDRFCVLTCPPHSQIADIHNRMPILIAPAHYRDWLDSSIPTQELRGLLQTPRNIAFTKLEIKPDTGQLPLF
ncbi:SOS response-associated peptidase [Terasakiella sp.]|uniref:SOS response-associated peptidase n=1 Tax=Terasakiella sp. TaxID=2034861 RepID=UPI003AA99388